MFAVFVACVTFLLIIAGALVTSNDAGLSVPDWPTSFGSLYKIPHLVGGVRFEHTPPHDRRVRGLAHDRPRGLDLARRTRRWMKYLGLAALGTVIAQGILGGLTVLFYLPPPISSAHARWPRHFSASPSASPCSPGSNGWRKFRGSKFDTRRPSLFTLTLLSIFVLYVQLILGAMFRHHGMSWWPHVVNAGHWWPLC